MEFKTKIDNLLDKAAGLPSSSFDEEAALAEASKGGMEFTAKHVLGIVVAGAIGLALFGGSPDTTPAVTPINDGLAQHMQMVDKVGYNARQLITNNARNPDSVSFSYVGVSSDYKTVCVQYRGQNGFGGYSRGTFVGSVVGDQLTGQTDNARQWNKHCAGKSLNQGSTASIAKWAR